jgi:YVTN family beta-propeller protein
MLRSTTRWALLVLAAVCVACATPAAPPQASAPSAAPGAVSATASSAAPSATPASPAGLPTVTDRVRVGFNPIGVAVTPDGKYVYVANSSSGTISKVDTQSRAVVSTIQLDVSPAMIALAPAKDLVCITSRDSQFLVFLSLSGNYLVGTLILPYVPERVLINTAQTLAYVSSPRSPYLMVVDLGQRKVIQNVALTDGSVGLAQTPDGQTLFVSVRNSNYNLLALSTAEFRVIGRASAGSGAGAIVLDPAGQYAYVANQVSGDLTVIHVPTWHPVLTIPLGVNPLDLKVTPSGRYVYVTAAQNTVLILDTATRQVVQKLDLGVSPWELDISPDGSTAYVGNYQARVSPEAFASDQIDLKLGLNAADRVNNNTLLFIATGRMQ